MKIAADLSAEEKEMAEYSNYCDDETREKARASKEKDLAALAAQRAADKANFQSTEKELMSAVDELDTTVVMYKREMQAGFLQSAAVRRKPAGKALMKQLTK